MVLIDRAQTDLIIVEVDSGSESQEKNTTPFAEFSNDLAWFYANRKKEGRENVPFSTEDWLAVRNVVEPLLSQFTDGSPIIPWFQERLNPYRADNIPCHRLELDQIEHKHNWRDAGADVAAIPFAPPISILLNPPQNLYEVEFSGNARGFDARSGYLTLDEAVINDIFARGVNQLYTVAARDQDYQNAIEALWKIDPAHPEEIMTKVIVTWAIDSAIPGVDVQRIAAHARSIEAICGDNPDFFEIPSIARLSELSHESKKQLERLHRGLAEMAKAKNGEVFTDYDERSVDLYMQARSVVDACRWHLEQNKSLSKSQREILNQTLVEAYTTYHAIVQTCGPVKVDDIRSFAHRDVSVLLAGGKIDTEFIDEQYGTPDMRGEEDYLGAFMAAASYDVIANEYSERMQNIMPPDLNWHGGARSYFGSFEGNSDSALRQQLLLMEIMYLRMPVWQRDLYQDLISSEIEDKISRVGKVRGNSMQERAMLYIPTQDSPVEVTSRYGSAFYWIQEKEVYASQHLMPIMDLIANYKYLMQDPAPRSQIRLRPGIRGVLGMAGSVNEKWIFVPEAEKVEATAEVPPLFVEFLGQYKVMMESNPGLNIAHNYIWEEWYKEKLALLETFVRTRTSETSDLAMPFLEPRLNPLSFEKSPCKVIALPEDYIKNNWESRADHALIPHMPPLEYLLDPPPNLWEPNNTLASNESPISDSLSRLIREQILRFYGSVEELEPLLNDPDKLIQVYFTWAQDTRMDGVEAMYAEVKQRNLQYVFNKGRTDIDYENMSKDEMNEIYLIMPPDLMLEVGSCSRKLEEILEKARNHLDKSLDHGYIPSSGSVHELASHVERVILAARWHLDHRSSDDVTDMTEELKMLSNTLESAYLIKNTILQELCLPGTSKTVTTDFHDISVLIAGYKIDCAENVTAGDKVLPSYNNDYFDAFMAVANARQVARNHESMFGRVGDRQHGARPLLGSFEAQAIGVKQQLAMLTTIYLRMPEWQRRKYKLIINDNFDALRYEIDAKERNSSNYNPEPFIFVPSASNGVEKDSAKMRVYEFEKPALLGNDLKDLTQPQILYQRQQLYRAQHLNRLDLCLLYVNRPSISKNTDGVEVFHHGAQVRGFGSGDCWIDSKGFVHPGYEEKRVEIQPSKQDNAVVAIVEQIGGKQENQWLSNLTEGRTITVESRLGPEIAEKIETLLDQDINNGSVENLGSLSVMLEQLLGRELTEGDSKYLAMLQSLGMLHREAIDISGMGEKEIRDMLAFVKTEKPKLEDMDESSLILLFLGAAGVAPRQELVEQIIKAHETTANILTLEAVEAIESISKKKKNKLLVFLGIIPKEEDKKSFLTRRDELRNYLSQKRVENLGYKPEIDNEWREMQITMVKYIVDLVHSAKSYDSSADSTISSVLAARDKRRFLARCHTNGQILTTMLNLGIPEFKANFTSDYGPEGNLTIEEFLRHLLSAEESGAASHAYSSSNRYTQGDNPQKEVVIADGESGKVRLVAADNVLWRYPSEMVYGTLANHLGGDGYEERNGVLQSCVTGGSTVSSDIASDMDQLDLAEMADPDSYTVNFILMRSKGIGIERRAKALRKIMELYPYMLAMAPKNDYANHILMHRLSCAIEVGREAGNWGAAFFASNIMSNAVFLGNDANEQGLEYRKIFARKLAVLKQGQYEAVLKNNAAHLTTTDLELIALAREEYLSELAEMMRKSNEPDRKIEKELKKKKKAESAAAFKASRENTERISSSVKDDDLRRKREDEKVYGVAEGSSDKDEYKAAADQKTEAINKETVDPNIGELNDNRFQPLSEQAQDALLLAAVTGQDGNLLEGSELDARIAAIQHLFVKYAFDHKRLMVGATGSMLMLSGGSDSSLVKGFEDTATMLNNRLSRGVERVGLPVDVSKFSPREIAEQMNPHTVQDLLGRGSTKQITG